MACSNLSAHSLRTNSMLHVIALHSNAPCKSLTVGAAETDVGFGAAVSSKSASIDEVLEEGYRTGAFAKTTERPVILEGAAAGPLSGLTFCVKDMYDVSGFPTGFGSPSWLETHPDAADATAPAIQRLLDAGATLVGKTVMDEMAYSVVGSNAHYGTPLNPRAPSRVPGGSSSGTASAVGSGLVDFGIGSDTAGSVRVPASLCGLFGMRLTHGRISMEGARPLQPSLDTVGWFSRSPEILQAVGHVLLKEQQQGKEEGEEEAGKKQECPENARVEVESELQSLKGILVAADALDIADSSVTTTIYTQLSRRKGEVLDLVGGGTMEEVRLGEWAGGGVGGLTDWMNSIRVLQMWEAWRCHGRWISETNPKFGPDVAARFAAAASVRIEEAEAAMAARVRISEHMRDLLADGWLLLLPSAPSIAPPLDATSSEMESFRHRCLCLSVVAGPAGLPQVSLPIAEVDGCPIGLGVVAAHGCDEILLAFTRRLVQTLERKDFVQQP
eukprot:TRINITY_DN17038_c0_g1_i1.p1 TRINITY_DN17038_c0_g1~~TRINITY_DN17038_c0_g1_i1.p1  ORF type:complete len:517 (-),score=100.36 TRINITY_DN17038_c0_g1_i1:184-1683(-)